MFLLRGKHQIAALSVIMGPATVIVMEIAHLAVTRMYAEVHPAAKDLIGRELVVFAKNQFSDTFEMLGICEQKSKQSIPSPT